MVVHIAGGDAQIGFQHQTVDVEWRSSGGGGQIDKVSRNRIDTADTPVHFLSHQLLLFLGGMVAVGTQSKHDQNIFIDNAAVV